MDHHGNRRQFSGSDTTNTIVWGCHQGRPEHGMVHFGPNLYSNSPRVLLVDKRYQDDADAGSIDWKRRDGSWHHHAV